ncbi:MAG TPA: hypothetical protein DCZ94_03860 [Lentisphaeria bacterium]|nr:MAG: hypothetical protein A2X48_05080 [Lentisphaerae bacterium GWF2_49_21]HBC86070.1 hypothetical protein [Lentisphaeria bacterium]
MKKSLLLVLSVFCFPLFVSHSAEQYVEEGERQIPVAGKVDVLVVGGGTGAVSAAVAAAQKGSSVFLMAPRPYLGDDMCATLQLWLKDKETPVCNLARAIYETDKIVTPMKVKKVLDQALLDAKVQFLYSCMPCDVLKDLKGNVCGVVMVNRAGRQAVIAKIVIDATGRGIVARMAGVKFTPYPAGEHVFTRVVIGGTVSKEAGVKANPVNLSFPYASDSREKKKKSNLPDEVFLTEYTIPIEMPDDSYKSFAKAEQIARDRTNLSEYVYASESISEIPPDHLISVKSGTAVWSGADRIPLEPFIPQGAGNLIVLGPLGDIPREHAALISRPIASMDLGGRIGTFAAESAAKIAVPQDVKVSGQSAGTVVPCQVREPLDNVRPFHKAASSVPQEARNIPVIGEYDVVVIGGGTSGAPAGIAAARKKMRTLVVEYLPELGGVTTMGLINKYYFGNRVGFTSELDDGVASAPGGTSLVRKTEWFRRELAKAGADVWFNSMGCGALTESGKVKGVIVTTPNGRGAVLAKVVIDSTGNSDVAIAAGASYIYVDETDIAIQGAGLPVRALGAVYTNTDYTFTDETDMIDVFYTFMLAKKNSNAFDLGQLLDTRERRRIVGDFVLTPVDEVNQRTYDDTIVQCKSNFDCHGYTVDKLFFLRFPDKKSMTVNVPYRCLLPKGLDGILVTGLGASAQRDAMPPIRMQPDLQNQGYAAGIAASMAVQNDGRTRKIDMKKLQEELVSVGILSKQVLMEKDSYPLANDKLHDAVRKLNESPDSIPILLSSPEKALPLLQKTYRTVSDEKEKKTCAQLLAMMGDPSGLDLLIKTVETTPWDKGWNFKGMGQYGPSFSQLDAYVVALGMTKDKRAVPVLVLKMKELNESSEFSHFRSVAMALERIGDKSAVDVLAEKLSDPKLSGHAVMASTEIASKDSDRSDALQELMLARALFKLGDKNDIGKKILQQYSNDIRGPIARHASAVLEAARK